MPPPKHSNGLGIAALVIGIVSVILACTPLIGVFAIVLGVIALILGIIGVVIARGKPMSKATAIAGIVLGAVAILIAGIMTAVTTAAFNNSSQTQAAPAPAVSAGGAETASGNVDDASAAQYVVTIDKAKVVKDSDGKSAVIVTYTFTNNSDKAEDFMLAITDKAFQNGVQLDRAYPYNVKGYDFDASSKDVKPGAKITVYEAYSLVDKSTVSIECTESFSFSDAILAKKDFDIK